MAEKEKTALIIGAGPAGLTAAVQFLRESNIRPIVMEASDSVGGISRTVNFQGYRMDLGGHRFFSKSDWVMDWWQQMLPLDPAVAAAPEEITLSYHNRHRRLKGLNASSAAADAPHKVMLLRNRLSRIHFGRKFYDYPVSLNWRLVRNLGPLRCLLVGLSYLRASVKPRHPERHLEDFLVNRFGSELYHAFFKSYTEKVWGVPCTEISPEWGAQRIKGLSLIGAARHALRQALSATPRGARQGQHVSLIERFLYPRLGPGQLWEQTAETIRTLGGEILLSHCVDKIELSQGRVTRVSARNLASGESTCVSPDWVVSTMAVKDLVTRFDPPAPEEILRTARSLPYRNFVTVGVILSRMKRRPGQMADDGINLLPDNWIYVQDPDVRMGRLQIFNNWSPALVADPNTVWLGLEYFCTEDDELWRLSDAEMQALAVRELEQINLADAADVIAATVIRVPKAYPAYFGAYADFPQIRTHVDAIANLFLVGRNGMHRYNNQDHSMLTAKTAVENIISGRVDKNNIWDINVDDDYHEARVVA